MDMGLRITRVALGIVMCLSPLAAGVWVLGCSIEPYKALRAYKEHPSDQTRRAMEQAFAADARRRYGGVAVFGLTFVGSAVGSLVITRQRRVEPCGGETHEQQRTI